MRSWIKVVTMTTVTPSADMPMRMAQTRRMRLSMIARIMWAIWAEGSWSSQPRVYANLKRARLIMLCDGARVLARSDRPDAMR